MDASYTDRYICIMKFTPRSEETRQYIIETTADLFNTRGYAGTSMSDITEATKLTKGSVYGNFENKEEVALAAVDYLLAQRVSIIKEQLSKAITWKEKLLVYPTIYNSKNSHLFPEGGCPLLNIGTEADDTNEALRKKIADAFGNWKKELESIITKGIEAKEFRKDVNAEKTALSIMALIEGSILISRVMRKPAYHDTMLDTVKDIIQGISLK